MDPSSSGCVAFAWTRKGVALGRVVERSPGRVHITNETGQPETWTEDRVFWVSEIVVAPGTGRLVAEALAIVRTRVEAAVPAVDLEALWDLLAGEDGSFTPDDLESYVASGRDPIALAALAWALAQDRLWFKAEGSTSFRPRTRAAVEATIRERERVREEQERLDRVLTALQAALDRGPLGPESRDAAEGRGWLISLALFGDDGSDAARRGQALVDRLPAQGRDPSERAFDLLVRLGVYGPDEILGLHRHGLRPDFDPAVMTEAVGFAHDPFSDDATRGRATLRPAPGFPGPIAIDDPWTTDVDDALMVEPLQDGSTRVHVVIADPSAVVPLLSLVGREASHRVATCYLPVGRISMLPPVLSEGALSLDGDADRPALDFSCDLSDDGRLLDFHLVLVWATLDRRLGYDAADELLLRDDSEHAPTRALRILADLAGALRERRKEAGALLVERDDVTVRVVDGDVVLSRQRSDSPSHRLVQEYMVLAATAAGRLAREQRIPMVYRRQPPPDLPLRPRPEGPSSRAWAFQTLRVMKPAELCSRPELHWALGVTGYAPVTSPLRRFQDFLAHLQLKSLLRGGPAPLDDDRVLQAFGDLEARGDAIAQVQREARRYWLLKWLAARADRPHAAEVVATLGSRALVELLEPCLVLPLPAAPDLQAGTRLEIRIRDVDPRRDRVTIERAR
jgi:exoribonuclease II